MVESEQKVLLGSILTFHDQLERVDSYDHVIFPPVYHQVGPGIITMPITNNLAQLVTFAIYSYFGLCLVGEQVGVLLVLLLLLLLQVSHPDLLPHLPGLLILKFIFFFGWLEVAGAISNPWGTDPDDFQV